MSEHVDKPGSPPPPESFRAKALAAFTRLLGEPAAIAVENGTIYRWRRRRKGFHDVNVYITIDAPELPDFAHVMISDPAVRQGEPVRSFMIRGEIEIEPVLAYLRAVIAE
jgi:hypothetical protein